MRLAPTTILRSKALKYFVLPFTLWHTYTIHVSIVSRLKHSYLTCLLPFIYTDWSGLNKGSPGFTWSVYVMERAGVPNVLSTQCLYNYVKCCFWCWDGCSGPLKELSLDGTALKFFNHFSLLLLFRLEHWHPFPCRIQWHSICIVCCCLVLILHSHIFPLFDKWKTFGSGVQAIRHVRGSGDGMRAECWNYTLFPSHRQV